MEITQNTEKDWLETNFKYIINNLLENDKKQLSFHAIKQHGILLEYVPDKIKTPELCIEAVKQNGLALEFVPEKLRTEKLCIEAINQVEKTMKTATNPRELCLNMVELIKKLKLIK